MNVYPNLIRSICSRCLGRICGSWINDITRGIEYLISGILICLFLSIGQQLIGTKLTLRIRPSFADTIHL